MMPLFAIFAASLLGSAHCGAMCGGFVAVYALKTSHHVAYNFGRLVTYIVLGACAGLLGSSINDAAILLGIQRGAALVLGALMILWGTSKAFSFRLPLVGGSNGMLLAKPLKIFLKGGKRNGIITALVVGLLSTLLPCGWLYGYLAVAATSASPTSGAVIMLVFWLGTLPVLIALGQLTSRLSAKYLAQLPRVSGALIIAAGIFAIVGRTAIPFDHSHHHGAHQGHTAHESAEH